MHRSWGTIIRPLLDLASPKVLVEIGAKEGYHTEFLVDYCRSHSARIHSIDPNPEFSVEKFSEELGKIFFFHNEISLRALHDISDIDAVLIDGDHNWYTVYNELTILRDKDPERIPLIILHDTAWPYARRDMYYEPESIPDDFRHPYEKKGLELGRKGLLADGKFNCKLNNARTEGGEKNGVLTAIEDFVAEADMGIGFCDFPALGGIGIIYSKNEYSPRFYEFIDQLTPTEIQRSAIENVEFERIKSESTIADQAALIKQLNAKVRKSESTLTDQAVLIKQLNTKVRKSESMIEDQAALIKQLNAKVRKSESTLTDQAALIKQLNAKIRKSEPMIADQTALIKQLNAKVRKFESTIADQSVLLKQRNADVRIIKKQRDNDVNNLQKEIKKLLKELNQFEETEK